MCCISQVFVVMQMPDYPQLQWLKNTHTSICFVLMGLWAGDSSAGLASKLQAPAAGWVQICSTFQGQAKWDMPCS